MKTIKPADWRLLYVAGPMSGHNDLNFPTFRRITQVLRTDGHRVMPPHEVDHQGFLGSHPSYTFRDYLRDDIKKALIACNALCLIPGWPYSRGAMAELHVASSMGYEIFMWVDDLQGMIDMGPTKACGL